MKDRELYGKTLDALLDSFHQLVKLENSSIVELCERIGISRQAFYAAISPRHTRSPILFTIARYADALDCDVKIVLVPRPHYTAEAEGLLTGTPGRENVPGNLLDDQDPTEAAQSPLAPAHGQRYPARRKGVEAEAQMVNVSSPTL